MADNFTNTTVVKTNSFSHMVKDVTDVFMSEGLYTHAIHAINKAHYGERGAIGNEPSNKYCTAAPFTIIGTVYKENGEWVLFSTNDVHSEIGIFNEHLCSYNRIVNDDCLDFKRTNLITGVCKENYDCTWSVYWQDARNPDRVMNLDNPPYIPISEIACQEPVYSNNLDCEALRLHPLIDQPCIELKRGIGAGELRNGSYFAVVAYSENGIKLTDYSMPSNVQSLWNHVGVGGNLEINVSNLDPGFNEFELVIVSIVAQQTVAKKVGYYPITYSTAGNGAIPNSVKVTFDELLPSLPTVDLALIPMKSVVYEKCDKMFGISDTLIRSGVTTHPYFNYQPLANQIYTRWVAVRYPADYYWNGGKNVGYMRDEIYSFFIRWVYKTGARSASFHIPGRESVASDITAVSGLDVLQGENLKWQVYDTSSYSVNTGTTEDGGVIVARGQMAYWETADEYYPPNQPEVWGNLCNKKIRHHKMPSNETIKIHETVNGVENIFVLGVEFGNIQPPINEVGDVIEDIVGYEILRGSRQGNRTVVAKGLFNNMWEYNFQTNSILPNSTVTQMGLFQNYPYNDLNPDPFLADNYNVLGNINGNVLKPDEGERLTSYRHDMFSFHSPETNFIRPYLGSNYIKLYSEEIGEVVGHYEFPHLHPQTKLISDAAFLNAAFVGVGIGLLAAMGKTTVHGDKTIAGGASFIANAEYTANGGSAKESGSVTALSDLVPHGMGLILGGNWSGTASFILSLGFFVANFLYFAGEGTNQYLEIIRNISKWRDYILQYNSHGFYNDSHSVSNGVASGYGVNPCIRRSIYKNKIKYINSGIQDFDSTYRINNLYRNKYVCLQTIKDIPDPVAIDNTKQRVTSVFDSIDDYKYNKFVLKDFKTQAVSYYGAIKVPYANQYGQLDSIVQMPTHACIFSSGNSFAQVFGGDVYINRYTEKSPYFFFNTWQYNMPNGTEYNYRNYVNGPPPRFWFDSNNFDMDDFNIAFNNNIDLTGTPPDQNTPLEDSNGFFNNLWNSLTGGGSLIDFITPSDFHRLDRYGSQGLWIVKYAYSYLFYNGVRDFYTESELNMAYRDYGEEDYEKFYDPYGQSFTDINYMFRSDIITKPIYHKYDLSLSVSRLFGNFASWGKLLPRDYNPTLYNTCFEYYPNRVVYSLTQQDGLRRDNWRNFLPLNYKDFPGVISTMKSLNTTGAIILFEDCEPMVFYGIDQLQTTSGVKFTIGDGGLFQQNWQSMVNADDVMGYGECISSRSAVNTPYGLFWVSQKNGNILHYVPGSQPRPISGIGLKHWFAEYLPSQLLTYFPNYRLYDNPIVGIGCQAVYDPQYELVYFTKKDYVPLDPNIQLDPVTNDFYIIVDGKIRTIDLTDKQYFEPCNWVASFDPTIPQQGGWVSFHLWTPTLMIPSYKHFHTINDNTIWEHNNRTDSFCNFYDTSYAWEVEYPIVTPNNVTTLRSVEYYLDCYTFSNDGRDYFHVLDENFDRCIIYNSEQNSGLLRLQIKGKNAPLDLIQYPQITPNHITILFSKEENKFRFDKFWDATRDRGEFSGAEVPMWDTSCNGVEKLINTGYINYFKSPLQHKKFRHYGNKIILRKNPVGRDDVKMVLKLTNTKELQSFR